MRGCIIGAIFALAFIFEDASSERIRLFLIEISDLPSNLVAIYTIILHLFFGLCVQNFLWLCTNFLFVALIVQLFDANCSVDLAVCGLSGKSTLGIWCACSRLSARVSLFCWWRGSTPEPPKFPIWYFNDLLELQLHHQQLYKCNKVSY